MAGRKVVEIQAPRMEEAEFLIRFTAPYVQNKFSQKAREELMSIAMAGSRGKKGKKRESVDYDVVYRQAMHICDGWCGIPAPAFRAAMISACRLVGFQMTRAKLGIFIVADGFDDDDGTPLVKITKGKPERLEMVGRNSDLSRQVRVRPMWRECECLLRVRYDADMFSLADVANLLMRAGMQVGVGEGRPDSKSSAGQGWGLFEIEGGGK